MHENTYIAPDILNIYANFELCTFSQFKIVHTYRILANYNLGHYKYSNIHIC